MKVRGKLTGAVSLGSVAGTQRLDDTITRFTSTRESFEQSPADLVAAPDRGVLDQETVDKLERLPAAWAVVEPSVNTIQEELAELRRTSGAQTALARGVFRYVMTSGTGVARDEDLMFHIGQLAIGVRGVESASGTLDDQLVRAAETIAAEAAEAARLNTAVSAGIVVIATAFAVAIMLIFSGRLANRVRGMEAAMRRVAERDFTVATRSAIADEIGELGRHIDSAVGTTREALAAAKQAAISVETLQESLSSGTEESTAALHQISRNIESIRAQFARLNETAIETTKAVEQIGGLMSDLTGDLENEDGAVEDASSSVDEMNAAIRDVARLASERREGARELLAVIASGGEAVESANAVIEQVSRRSRASTRARQAAGSASWRRRYASSPSPPRRTRTGSATRSDR